MGYDRGHQGFCKEEVYRSAAVNTVVWRHPITAKRIRELEEERGVKDSIQATAWFEVLRPVEKEMPCGIVGDGAMRDWEKIVNAVEERTGLGN